MGMSLYFSDGIMAQTFNGTAFTFPGTFYCALFTVQPSGGTGGTEASYAGYARIAIPATTSNFTVPSLGKVATLIPLVFGINSGTAQTIVGYGFYDAATGGNLFTDIASASSVTINPGYNPFIPAGGLTITGVISP